MFLNSGRSFSHWNFDLGRMRYSAPPPRKASNRSMSGAHGVAESPQLNELSASGRRHVIHPSNLGGSPSPSLANAHAALSGRMLCARSRISCVESAPALARPGVSFVKSAGPSRRSKIKQVRFSSKTTGYRRSRCVLKPL